eukprot:9478010-Pyramimonas_sp.AAC.1
MFDTVTIAGNGAHIKFQTNVIELQSGPYSNDGLLLPPIIPSIPLMNRFAETLKPTSAGQSYPSPPPEHSPRIEELKLTRAWKAYLLNLHRH